MNITHYADPGSVSSGTLRPEDLIPAFVFELNRLINANVTVPDNASSAEDLAAYERLTRLTWQGFTIGSIDTDKDYESAMEYLSKFSDALDLFSPEGHSFGAHEGNSADFGFWPTGESV